MEILGRKNLSDLTSPLLTGAVVWGQYLSHSDSNYDRIPLDDSAGE